MSLPEPRPRRRGLGGAFAVLTGSVLAGVLAGVLVAPAFRPTAGPKPGTSTSSETPNSPTPPPSVRALPVSDPLGPDELVIPIKRGGEWELDLGRTDASKPTKPLIRGNPDANYPVLSEDRRTMIYIHTENRARTLRVAAVDGSGDRALFDKVPAVCAGRITRPAWHPTDPTLLAVPCIDGDGAYGLHLIRTDGTLVRTLELGGKKIGDATWNGDGTRLAFWSGEPDSGLDGGAIFVADGSGADPLQVTDGRPGQDADPAWNPAGDVLVFRRQISDTVSDLYTVPGDGSDGPVVLLSTKTAKSDPSWSPSGDQIAFNSDSAFRDHGRVTRVWLMNIDGSSPLPLWRNPSVVGREQSTAAWTRR